MIDHLKKIHRILYLPRVDKPVKPSFKVTPITEPYLYTDTNLYVDAFDSPIQSVKILDSPIQSVKVEVSNIGGGNLYVERIRIPQAYGKWVKRAESPKPTTLTSRSDPIEIELNILLKELPNPSSVNVAKLPLISKPKQKSFDEILLGVRPPDNQASKLMVPEYINFGEITVWKVSIADHREDNSTPPTDFLLIGLFTLNPPTSLEITQKDEFCFDAKMRLAKGEMYYNIDLRIPGVVKPRLSPNSREINIKSMQQSFQVANTNQHTFSEKVTTSDTEWLAVPSEISIAGYGTTSVTVSAKVDKLKQGRNVGEISVSNKKITVWAWHKIINETTLTLEQEQPNIHHIEKCPEQEKPLPIEVESTNAQYQSFMIFEDFDFQFPLVRDDQIGYLMGDFNNWTPRTLFLEKRDSSFGVTLSIPEGSYYYRAEIDGEMRLDPANLHEIVCCSHGLASKIQVKRREQKITLQNRSNTRIKLKLQSSTKWMRIEPETISIAANRKKEITAIFHPEFLQPGLNLGWIQMETEEETNRSLHTPIFVVGKTDGAVPILRNAELAFPQIEQGKIEGIPLELHILGAGELKGQVQPSTVLRFAEGDLHIQNNTSFEPISVTPLLQILSEKPSNAYRKQIHASLVTDCYLANRRLLPFIAKYDMIHLVSDPPALYFPKVHLFDDPKHADVMVKRSDGKGVVECTVEIPEALSQSRLLKVRDSKTEICEFILDPQVLTKAKRVTGSLHVRDEKSGMTLPIQFAADIIGGKAKIEVKTQKQDANGIPLVITNVGKTELRIFDVEFKNHRFYLTPYLTSQQRTLLPGESIDRLIKAKKIISLIGKTRVRDTLIIRLNDPQYSKGVFEKEIEAVIHAPFLNFRR